MKYKIGDFIKIMLWNGKETIVKIKSIDTCDQSYCVSNTKENESYLDGNWVLENFDRIDHRYDGYVLGLSEAFIKSVIKRDINKIEHILDDISFLGLNHWSYNSVTGEWIYAIAQYETYILEDVERFLDKERLRLVNEVAAPLKYSIKESSNHFKVYFDQSNYYQSCDTIAEVINFLKLQKLKLINENIISCKNNKFEINGSLFNYREAKDYLEAKNKTKENSRKFMPTEEIKTMSWSERQKKVLERTAYRQASEKTMLVGEQALLFALVKLFNLKSEHMETIKWMVQSEPGRAALSYGVGEIIAQVSDHEMAQELSLNFQTNGVSKLVDVGLNELMSSMKIEFIPFIGKIMAISDQIKSGNTSEAMKEIAILEIPAAMRVEIPATGQTAEEEALELEEVKKEYKVV